MKLFLALAILTVLNGCSLFQHQKLEPTVRIVKEPIQVKIYQPPTPAAIDLENIQWHVITEDNLEEKIAEISTQLGGEFVVFAMTPQSYENITYNLQEIKRYLNQQKQIIIYYRSATLQDFTKDGEVTAEDWLEQNKKLNAQDTD